MTLFVYRFILTVPRSIKRKPSCPSNRSDDDLDMMTISTGISYDARDKKLNSIALYRKSSNKASQT